MYESATRDPLTHAVNRRGFEESLVPGLHVETMENVREASRAVTEARIDDAGINDTGNDDAGDLSLRSDGAAAG